MGHNQSQAKAMATSPPYAGSPPGSGTPISRKRPSLGSQISNAKRRKPSTAGPSHLRQTSFPPEEFPHGGRSPSVDSAAIGTPSVISGIGAGKRGKRHKSGSVIAGGSKVNGVGGRGASASAVDGVGPDEEPEEEDDEQQQNNLHDDEANTEGREREAEAQRLIRMSFTKEQAAVYDAFHAAGAGNIRNKIRKLVNHTLSQSVPQSVVGAISSYTKVFMGDVIEEARRVQMEWMASEPNRPDGSAIPEDASMKERIKEEWRGPLTPDHLREAVRRLKKDRAGGAGGFLGVSLTGKERTAAKMGGRRLFR